MAVMSVSFSPDGSRIVTGGGDDDGEGVGRTHGHCLARAQRAHGLDGHGVSFSPDGSRIVTGSEDKTAKVWDARTALPCSSSKGTRAR